MTSQKRSRGVAQAQPRTGDKAAMNGDWLTPREVAQYLRVGVDSVYDACAVGGLKHVKLGYRTIRVRRDWVDTWADEKARQFGSPSDWSLPPGRSQRAPR